MTAARKVHVVDSWPAEGHELVVSIPVRTVSETNAREHWSQRHKRRRSIRSAVGLVVVGALRGAGVTAPCGVLLTRCAPSGGLDDDNLVSSLKAARDGVADALGIDDRDPRVSWSYAQRRGKRGEWAVEVCIKRRNQTGKIA